MTSFISSSVKTDLAGVEPSPSRTAPPEDVNADVDLSPPLPRVGAGQGETTRCPVVVQEDPIAEVKVRPEILPTLKACMYVVWKGGAPLEPGTHSLVQTVQHVLPLQQALGGDAVIPDDL